MKILSSLAIAAALLASISSANAQATNMGPTGNNQMVCTEQAMTKANSDMQTMPDSARRTDAMREMAMARDMMARGDMEGCRRQWDRAMGMMR